MIRKAVIDLGTNTFHLLIADIEPNGNIHRVHEEKFIAKIGQGGISKGLLTDEAYQRTLQALHHFRAQINKFSVHDENITAMATSAIRNASNGKQLVAEIYQQTRITIQVISGDKEAEYIYYGVRAGVPMGDAVSMVMDIGGGSVEFIICTRDTIFWKQSFEIGAQRLLDMFMHTDPISYYSVQKLQEYLQAKIIPLTNAVHQYAPQVLIGASGSFETLCEIWYKKSNPAFQLGESTFYALPIEAFYEIYQQLLQKTQVERIEIPGMLEMRADMIVVASCLIDFILKTYKISKIMASTFSLKEGVLINEADKN